MSKKQLQQYVSDLYDESVRQSHAIKEIKEYYENINEDKSFKEKLIVLLKEEEGNNLTDFIITDLAQYLIEQMVSYQRIRTIYS